MFNVLWTILLGIIGGVISSVIVSRVFMIQGEYHQQMKFVDGIIQKLGMIAGYLSACKTVFEVSYDEDVQFEREKEEKGYKNEHEYYAAHGEKRWISKEGILETFKSEMLKVVETAKEDILNSNITDENLNRLLGDIREYLHKIEAVEELKFSIINEFRKKEQKLLAEFESCKRISGKQLVTLVIKDKLMIVVYTLIGVLVVLTFLAFSFGW